MKLLLHMEASSDGPDGDMALGGFDAITDEYGDRHSEEALFEWMLTKIPASPEGYGPWTVTEFTVSPWVAS